MFEKCYLDPSVEIEGHPVGEGANLHPYGHQTDPFVWFEERAMRPFNMLLNYPVRPPGSSRWWTAAYQTQSDDGANWHEPWPVKLPDFGHELQYETPTLLVDDHYDDPMKAFSAYNKIIKPNGNFEQREHVQVYHGKTRLADFPPPNAMIEPDKEGNIRGGWSEPSLVRYGPFVVCAMQAHTYAGGQKPSLWVAASSDEGRTWLIHPAQIQADPVSETGLGQVSLHKFRGGFLMVWQRRIRERMSVMASWTKNWLDWSTPIELFDNSEEWFGLISGPCFVELPDSQEMFIYFHGWPEAEPKKKVHWIARHLVTEEQLELVMRGLE